MMNHSRKSIRIRRLRCWRDGVLEHVSYIVVFLITAYVFVYLPLARSMGW